MLEKHSATSLQAAATMELLSVLVCLGFICVASTLALDPRGARPVEQGTRSEKCESQKEWPFCTDDQWGAKCPSGCRMQGLIDKYDHGSLKKIEKIRSLLQQNEAKHRSADQVSKQTYDYLKEKLTVDSGNDNDYYGLAQRLRQRITDMKIKIDLQLRILATLKEQVKDQVVEMQRLEVDIDIKLRSCKGSCETHHEHQVDQESYVTLEKQVNQLDTAQNIEAVGTLYVMKSRQMKDVTVDSVFKSKDVDGSRAEQKTGDMFNDVQTVQLVIGEEGSKMSPATISKVPVCTRQKQNRNGRQPSGHSQTYRKQRCRAPPDVALCSDDDWVSKCPSGCRLQGLVWQMESKVDRKLRAVCKTVKMNEDVAEKSMAAMAHIYSYNRRVLVSRHMDELRSVEEAEGLARNLTSLRKRSSRLSLQLEKLHGDVQKQMEDLYQTEVDVDMKLRACRGSCRVAPSFSVDHLGYQALRVAAEQMDQTLNQRRKAATPPEDIPLMKLQPVDIGPPPAPEYKSIPAVQRDLLTLFEDIGQNRVVLEDLDPAELD